MLSPVRPSVCHTDGSDKKTAEVRTMQFSLYFAEVSSGYSNEFPLPKGTVKEGWDGGKQAIF